VYVALFSKEHIHIWELSELQHSLNYIFYLLINYTVFWHWVIIYIEYSKKSQSAIIPVS
jgi:hypothetical protein